MDDIVPIITAAGGVLCAGLPIIWRLASRLQKIESMTQGQTDEIKCKLAAIEADVAGVALWLGIVDGGQFQNILMAYLAAQGATDAAASFKA